MGAIIGQLSITMPDGIVLTDRTDVGLAQQWAQQVHGADAWNAMTFGEQSRETADALRALRESAGE